MEYKMGTISKLYPFGFVFSDLILDSIPSYYQTLRVLDTFNYHYDSSVLPYFYQNNDKFIVIHGHFTHVGFTENISKANVLKELLDAYRENYNRFLDIIDHLGGRYAVIIGSNQEVRVYQDACGCRSVYYAVDSNIIASHAHLIADNHDVKKLALVAELPKLSFSLTLSPFENVKSMLPNLYLDFFSKSLVRFFPRSENRYSGLSSEEKLSKLEKLWKEQLKQYMKEYSNIVFSITAGNDSRVSLALAKEYKDKMRFFTYSIIDPKSKRDYFDKSLFIDKKIVEEILQDIPLEHQFFIFERGKQTLSKDEIKIVAKNSILSHGRYLLKYYREAFPDDDLLHIRATLLEIGQATYLKTNTDNSIDAVKNLFIRHVTYNRKQEYVKELSALFDRTVSDFQYVNTYDYHLMDLYYWENRMGRWFPETLNETDSAFETLLPFNMRAIIEISLSYNITDRRNQEMFNDLINRNYPVLNFYGKNQLLNLYEQTKSINNDCEEKKLLLDSVGVYNAIGKKLYEYKVTENTVYIPEKYIKKENYAESVFTFQLNSGYSDIKIISHYFNSSGLGYLQYQIYINEKMVLIEDISTWADVNDIRLFGLAKGDEIKLRVVALKNSPFRSWEIASRVEVLSYTERELDNSLKNSVSYTSPMSINTISNQ